MASPNPWIEELDFTVEEWTLDRNRILEMLGRIHLYEMAVAAFDAATKMRPTSIITLRRGAQLLRERGSTSPASGPAAGRGTA